MNSQLKKMTQPANLPFLTGVSTKDLVQAEESRPQKQAVSFADVSQPENTTTPLAGTSQSRPLSSDSQFGFDSRDSNLEREPQATASTSATDVTVLGSGVLCLSSVQSMPSVCTSARLSAPASQGTSVITTTSQPAIPNQTHSSTRKKPLPQSRAYFIARELLYTERTYHHDLTILLEHFRPAVEAALGETDAHVLFDLFNQLQPIADCQVHFMAELEQKINRWESEALTDTRQQGEHRIADSMLCALHNALNHYRRYISQLAVHFGCLHQLYSTRRTFEKFWKEFEERKVTYQPVNRLLLKPAHRLLLWQRTVTRLAAFYGEQNEDHSDFNDARVASDKLSAFNHDLAQSVHNLENLVKLVAIERDMVGVTNLVHPQRKFRREGSLWRYSRRGQVQRMFVLFNDCLVYANRLEDGDPLRVAAGLQHCFTIYGGNRSLIIAAANAHDKQLWVEDIRKAAAQATEHSCSLPVCSSLQQQKKKLKTSDSASDMGVDGSGPGTIHSGTGVASLGASQHGPGRSPSLERQLSHRANDTLHVCWHRACTLHADAILREGRNQLSGYLLRKFRNSTGWQRLWVVCAHFCIYFFKSHQEVEPLASLPMLGYIVSYPQIEDNIHKEYVFKLSYKNHCYFFRADSDYTFNRWLEVMRSSCGASSPTTTPTSPLLSRVLHETC